MDLIRWLLDTSMGCPGPHGRWPFWLTICFHGSNLLISLAYLAVPVVLVRSFRFKREGIRRRDVLAALIFLPFMSLSRLVRFLEYAGPPYHLTTIVDTAAAVATLYGAWQMVRIADHVLMLPSRKQMHDVLDRLQTEVVAGKLREMEIGAKYTALKVEADAVRADLKGQIWHADIQRAMAHLESLTRILREG